MEPLDLRHVRTTPLASRQHKVHSGDMARVGSKGASFAQFLEGLPQQLAAVTFRKVVEAILAARAKSRPIVWGLGAHVIKCGLSPWIIEFMRRGLAQGIALNGGGSIHDIELALQGETSEVVEEGLPGGEFGLSEDTGRVYYEALQGVVDDENPGLGALLGRHLYQLDPPYGHLSILKAGVELGVPVTVHVSIGSDVVHMHPRASGAALGAASFADFRRFAALVAQLGDGGVYLNVGSAVVLPEVFLKAITVARNLGSPVQGLVTVNMDMLQHYRPLTNVVHRPTMGHGQGYALTGHHELMLPLLGQALLEGLP